MKDQALGVLGMLENAGELQLERDSINITLDDDRVADFDVVLLGDFFAHRAGGATTLESVDLIRRHRPVLADVEDLVRIHRKAGKEILGLFINALEPRPRRHMLHAGNRNESAPCGWRAAIGSSETR